MKNKKSIFVLFICVLFICCEKSKSVQDNTKMASPPINPSKPYLDDYNDFEKMERLTKEMNTGDTIAYKKLMHIYFYTGHTHEFLYNAMNMAEKYNYPDAYYHTYVILHSNNKLSKVNKLANYYLFLAYENKQENAKSTIKERFGDNFIIPNSEDYWGKIIETSR